ncbi:sigma-54 dependent transcriptional regulator [Rheinheimera salexigens]|uniref:Sigma-54-dependent Fis family transcriptional regulator n=1 Tax=Rheinheimera salexigens TaxID=1628148 RepID=A0A1E7Q853_9GAMM|nr:sigma-54-dependent Fis family transcriptional regulator [Rheinheimera salexigens]OEY70290.1 sigma-54-dependent Fis family transcriptional regulator [Rheinheimera salexigens]
MSNNPARSNSPITYIVDQQPGRAERLSTVLDFISEPHQSCDLATLKSKLADDATAVVLLGALPEQQHAEIIQRYPTVAFLLLGEPLKPLLQFSNVVGLLTDPFAYASLTQLLRDCQLYHRLMPRQRQHDCKVQFDGMVGNSEPMRQVRFLIKQVAATEANVLVLGDSGTGKEVVARNIHLLSHRKAGPFVPINCGAIPAELLESELFGHEKGAFTGAISTRKGRFELAQGGTLFLDEIGDMPQPMQVKLLRVLQERTYERVGGTQVIKADVRIIAATHRNLEQMIIDGGFREDLYYRLNVFPIETPSLQQRTDDLGLLIQALLQVNALRNKANVKFTDRAIESLKLHPWPGNVRELANLLERMVIMYPEQVVDVAELPLKYRHLEVESYQPEYPESLQERDLLNALFQSDDDDFDQDDEGTDLEAAENAELEQNNGNGSFYANGNIKHLPENGLDLKEHLAELEIHFISLALHRHEYVVARAAEVLGLRRTTLVEKMRKYNLNKED